MRILAISGSLRAASLNTALLRTARGVAPPGVEVLLYEGLGRLPHYNPDLDGDPLPEPVSELRRLVGGSSGLLVACPEYAHGIPGALKNLLDWLVGSTEFPGKPVALLNASPRATHAQVQLREVVGTTSARLVPEASIPVPLPGAGSGAAQAGTDRRALDALRSAVAAFAAAA